MIKADVIKLITAIDPAFAPLEHKFPQYPLLKSESVLPDPFISLIETVISQQLSGKAARTIAERLKNEIKLSPDYLAGIEITALREVGLSNAKARTIKELATTITAGLDLRKLSTESADEIRSTLRGIWGIGNWTVDMYLMFDLKEPDIWPINDLGVQKGWQALHNLPQRPTPAELVTLGEKFLGIRSAVAWYCWRALEI